MIPGQVGVNSLLDVARQTYKEANLDAADLVSKLSGKSSHNTRMSRVSDTRQKAMT